MMTMELKRGFTSRGFKLAIIIGVFIVILQYLWFGHHTYKVNQQELSSMLSLEKNDADYGWWFETGLLEGWIGCENYSMFNHIYYFAFPLIAVMPFALSYLYDWRSGYANQLITRAGRSDYHFSKMVAVFLSGGVSVSIPLVVSLWLYLMKLPVLGIDCISMQSVVSNADMLSEMYFNFPLIYALIYIFIDFFIGGIYATLTLLVSRFSENLFLAGLSPTLYHITLLYSVNILLPGSDSYNLAMIVNPSQFYATVSGLEALITIVLHIFILPLIFILTGRQREMI
ncbi:MAG: hypothetical protein IKQ71_01905 [Lachnospiraceae bacterium]|nr:hypothetical protein [Lachnospiraceae bacterium]